MAASVSRRLLSLVYEAFLLCALLWAAGLLYALVEHKLAIPHVRPLFQAYLVLVGGIYFTSQWVLGGQTLAMKTWRLRVLSRDGRRVTLRQGLARYGASAIAVPLFGVAYMWALVDPERQFLHDRLAGTRIVVTNTKTEG